MPVCIVKNCFSGSNRKGLYCDPKVQLHRFPKDVEMRALWVKQIQCTANVNKEIYCDTDAVCSLHFSLNSYEERTIVQNMLDYSPKCGRKLKPTAIPFSDGNQSSPIKTPAGLFSVTNSADESNSVEPAFSRKIPFQINLFGVSDTIPGVKCLENNEPDLFQKSKFENIIRMQNEKIEYYKNYVNLENQRFESRFSDILSKFFTSTQINQILHPSTKVSKWLPEDISSAITLRSISPKAYRYLRNKKQYPLPGLSTLRRWASTFEVDPGILESVLTLMKAKDRNLMTDDEKLTVIAFDETYISNRICYDKKNEQVIGPQRCVQTVVVRGLLSNWKQPIFYNYDTHMTKDLLFKIIEELHKISFNVISMVNDMGPSNMALWRSLNISHENMSFKHPNTGNRVHVFAFI